MHEKKIQENAPPDDPDCKPELNRTRSMVKPDVLVPVKAAPLSDKAVPQILSPPVSVPLSMKSSPNDMYRRLLPAVLFLLTFVTVMTMLLIYMDTVALGAQQFRLNMSRDYELARIKQDSDFLVSYVRQWHLAPRSRPVPPPEPTPRNEVLDQLLGPIHNGTFIEFLPSGPREPTAVFLEAARGWSGVAVRAAARDFLALRGTARALHACLSPTDYPREITYQESDSHSTAFSSRVLCLPLYTVLLACDAVNAHYLVLGGDGVDRALRHLPLDKVAIQVIDIRSSDPVSRNKTTRFLLAHSYSVARSFPDGVLYALNSTKV